MIKLKDLLLEDKIEVLVASDRSFVSGHLDKIQKELNQAKKILKKKDANTREIRELSNSLKGMAIRLESMGEHVSGAIGAYAKERNRPSTSPYA